MDVFMNLRTRLWARIVACGLAQSDRFPFYVYFRIIGPYFDTLLILWNTFAVPGNLQTWTQLYFLCMMACNVLNGYFCSVIWQKGYKNFSDAQLKNWED